MCYLLMRIPRRYLSPDERLIAATRAHPVRLVGPAVRAIIGVTTALAIGYLATPRTGDHPVDVVAAMVALVVLARFLRHYLAWRRRRVALTDRRILRVSGGIVRRVSGIDLDDVVEVELQQGLVGRALGYATLHLVVGESRVSLEHLREGTELWHLIAEATREEHAERRVHPRRTLAPGVSFDRQETGPLPRVLV